MNKILFTVAIATCALFCVAESVSEEWVITPGGRRIWHECVREVPIDSHVVDLPTNDYIQIFHADGKEERMSRCSRHHHLEHPPFEDKSSARDSVNVQGWQVWTQYNQKMNRTFTTMTNYFTTPTAPSSWSKLPEVGIVYIFPGLQNDDWIPIQGDTNDAPPGFDIIQPVLQYGGGSANGGGKFWELANWYVTLDDSAVWTPATRVYDGDEIFGNMTMTDSSTWYIGAIVTRTGEVNGFFVTRPRLEVQNWAFVTLEVYNIFDCDHFPPKGSTSKFYDIQLTDQNGNTEDAIWDALESDNKCNAGINVVDANTVTMTFN